MALGCHEFVWDGPGWLRAKEWVQERDAGGRGLDGPVCFCAAWRVAVGRQKQVCRFGLRNLRLVLRATKARNCETWRSAPWGRFHG